MAFKALFYLIFVSKFIFKEKVKIFSLKILKFLIFDYLLKNFYPFFQSFHFLFFNIMLYFTKYN